MKKTTQKDKFSINKDKILVSIKQLSYVSAEELRKVLQSLKDDSLVRQSLSFAEFLNRLINEGLKQYNVDIRGKLKSRYTFNEEFDIYDFCNSLEKNSYFCMSTSLSLQGLSKFRSDFIFVAKQRTTRNVFENRQLTQEDIDRAFKKEPRRTNAYGELQGYVVVMLETNNTNSYEIIDFNGYKVSSVNRAFVEMINHVHYFISSAKIIEVFQELKNKLDVDKIYQIIGKFDFVYPYYQLVGFYLEKIGFDKKELLEFYKKKSKLKFYAEKNKNSYKFDNYWGIWY